MAGTIRGRVSTSEGQPVAGASVTIDRSEAPHHDLAFMTGDRGEFLLGGLQPGPYSIAVEVHGAPRQVRTVQVVNGDEARLISASR